MKNFLPLLLGLSLGMCIAPALAQGPTPRLTGRVLEASGQPLPGATVRLLHLPDSVVAAGTQTDLAGHYGFANAAAGRYLVQATAVGQAAARSAGFTLPPVGQPALTLPDLRLRPAAAQLKEVTVLGEQRAVEATAGKLVYNLDQRVSAAGTSAYEVLQRMPGVSITQDDNLVLKGSPSVNVMLDGKLTYLSGAQLAALLKNIPAENLVRVEMLTAPGAQYDAAGSAGLLNLVTKKSNRQGYALNLSTGAGTGRYPQTMETVVGNIKTKQVNVFGNYGYHYKKSYLNRTSYRVLSDATGPTTYDRVSFDPAEDRGHNYRAGVDIALGPHQTQTIGAVYSGYTNEWTRTGSGPTVVRNEGTGLVYAVHNKNLTREPGRNNAFNLNYKATLDTMGRMLTADADYAHYRFNSQGFLGNQRLASAGLPETPYQELAFGQPSMTTIRSVKADVVWSVAGTRLSGGGKYAAVRADNNFRYDSLVTGNYVYAPALSNHFVYDEQVFAAYATAGRKLGRTALDAGLRLETTHSVGNLLNRNQVNRLAYTNLFPTLTASRPFGLRHQVSLSLSRRINRPQYGDLNPARYFFDKFSYAEGNPFLQPETAWKGSVAYTYKNEYVLTLNASRTSNPIASSGRQNAQTGELVVTIENFAYRDDFDAQFVVPLKLAPWWTVQNVVDAQYVRLNYSRGANVFTPHQATLDLSSTHTLKLPGEVRLEVAAFYTSPSLAGINIFRTYFTVDAGLRKTFAHQKLDVRLAGSDLFHTIHYWGYSIHEAVNTSYNHRGDTRRVNLSLTYHLGGELATGRAREVEEAGRVR